MPPKEDSKKTKPKISQSEDTQKLLGSPNKKEEEPYKTVNLHDLSPFSPIMRTIKKSFDSHNFQCDFAMI